MNYFEKQILYERTRSIFPDSLTLDLTFRLFSTETFKKNSVQFLYCFILLFNITSELYFHMFLSKLSPKHFTFYVLPTI